MSHLMIPRRLHQIWLGDRPLPAEFEAYRRSWRMLHPDWELILWRDEDLPELYNRHEFESEESVAGKADILRYEILYHEGGIYADVDVECLRNVEPLLEGVWAFAGEEEPGLLCNALIGAVAGHPLLRDLIVETAERRRRYRDAGCAVKTGPHFLTEVAQRHEDVIVFPAGLFYPYSWREPHRKGEAFPDAYAVHHWARSWW